MSFDQHIGSLRPDWTVSVQLWRGRGSYFARFFGLLHLNLSGFTQFLVNEYRRCRGRETAVVAGVFGNMLPLSLLLKVDSAVSRSESKACQGCRGCQMTMGSPGKDSRRGMEWRFVIDLCQQSMDRVKMQISQSLSLTIALPVLNSGIREMTVRPAVGILRTSEVPIMQCVAFVPTWLLIPVLTCSDRTLKRSPSWVQYPTPSRPVPLPRLEDQELSQ